MSNQEELLGEEGDMNWAISAGIDGRTKAETGFSAFSRFATISTGLAVLSLAACSGAADADERPTEADASASSAVALETAGEIDAGSASPVSEGLADETVNEVSDDAREEESAAVTEKQADEPIKDVAAKKTNEEPVEDSKPANPPKTAVAAVVGDATAGSAAFGMCGACHTWEAGAHRAGPSLAGVVGRKSGAAEGFAGYSEGIKSAGIVWSAKTLDRYLKDPGAMVPGSTMSAIKVSDDQRRADLVAHIMQKGK